MMILLVIFLMVALQGSICYFCFRTHLRHPGLLHSAIQQADMHFSLF